MENTVWIEEPPGTSWAPEFVDETPYTNLMFGRTDAPGRVLVFDLGQSNSRDDGLWPYRVLVSIFLDENVDGSMCPQFYIQEGSGSEGNGDLALIVGLSLSATFMALVALCLTIYMNPAIVRTISSHLAASDVQPSEPQEQSIGSQSDSHLPSTQMKSRALMTMTDDLGPA